MKLLNVLFVICTFLVLSACSMDENSIMNDVDKEIQNKAEGYTSFLIGLNGSTSTKSSSSKQEESTPENPNNDEKNVSTCFLAIFNAETKQLITSYFFGEKDGDILPSADASYSLGQHLTFKVNEEKGVKPDLILVAIANVNPPSKYGDEYSSLKSLESCTNYEALINTRIIEGPTVLVKVGDKIIKGEDYTTSSSLLNPEDFCTEVNIPVHQRSASVELAKFTVKNRNTAGKETDLTSKVSDVSVNLQNVNLYTKVVGNDNQVEEFCYPDVKFENGKQEHRFYTYANSTGNKTKLTISYTLKGERKNVSYTIKTPTAGNQLGYIEEVRSNTLYKLNVTITNSVVDVDVKCYTLDWIKNEINVEL